MLPQNFDAVAKVDFAFYFIFGISIILLLGITAVAGWFVYRYHHSRNPKATDISGNLWAEVAWTVIPTIIVMAMFYYGWVGYKALRTVPDNAMTVKVTARMWSWVFQYENGKRSSVLYVPQGTPVRLDMTSVDVIHSLYIPAYRIKMDTVPRMDTYAWFNPDTRGSYDIFCAEYCGMKHANMISTVEVLTPEEFEAWYADANASEGAGRAIQVFETYGCLGCHSLDGTDGVGPSLKNLYGATRQVVMPDGTSRELVADEPYLRRAILDPAAELTAGYAPVMMPYEGTVSDDDLKVMVQWLMHGNQVSLDAGRDLMMAEGCISCHSTDGTMIAGPTLKNIWGRSVTVVENGKERTLTADRDYLIEAIVDPSRNMVKGFDPIMPPYEYLTPEQLEHMLEYMRSLSEPGADGQ